MIEVNVLADSYNSDSGDRLTTLELKYPRVVHSEFMTHRAFSRNAASSRARPVSTVIEDVRSNPYIPRLFDKPHKGMQPKSFISSEDGGYQDCVDEWLDARDYNIAKAISLQEKGVGKQVVNRLLEPFQHITVVCTATEWDNFIKLRTETDINGKPMADIPIYDLAMEIEHTLNTHTPDILAYGDWHIPFSGGEGWDDLSWEDQLRVAVARCARASYGTQGLTDTGKDLALYASLASDKHLSPMEHVACAWLPDRFANFRSFKSFRIYFEEGLIK